MNPQPPLVTPSRFSASVSPVQWNQVFSYTPESAREAQDGSKQHWGTTEDRSYRGNEPDALPTQFSTRPHRTVGGPGRKPKRGSGVNISAPYLEVSRRCRRRNGTTEAAESLQHTGKTRLMTQRTSTVYSGIDKYQDPSSSHYSPPVVPPRRPRRLVLDAVEIVRKKRPHSHTTPSPRAPVGSCSTEIVGNLACTHYPSPPISCSGRDDIIIGSSSRFAYPTEGEGLAGPDLISTLKTSKYFTPRSTPRSGSENIPALTPPASPMPAILTIDKPGQCLTWFNSPGLFDDLMIMLRRLKPILVQENVRDDPWKVLIAVRLLNVTTGKAAIPVFCKIISRWATPQDLVHAPQHELVELLRPLGLYNKRASWLKDMSERFLGDRRDPNGASTSLTSLLSDDHVAPSTVRLYCPGVGPYALDSLRIFCAEDKDTWKRVMPRDKELVRYLRWRWAVDEGKIWYPDRLGVVGNVDVPYLITLVDELAAHYDDAIGGEGYMYHFSNDLCDALSCLP